MLNEVEVKISKIYAIMSKINELNTWHWMRRSFYRDHY
jgi:hypothetical protein